MFDAYIISYITSWFLPKHGNNRRCRCIYCFFSTIYGWWFSHCCRVWAARDSYHIHQVVKHLESDHKKNCEEILRENNATHGVVPAGCPMCHPMDHLQSFSLTNLSFTLAANYIWGNPWMSFSGIWENAVKCWNWTLVDHFMLACNIIYLIFRPPKSQRSRNTTHPVSFFLGTPESLRKFFTDLGYE